MTPASVSVVSPAFLSGTLTPNSLVAGAVTVTLPLTNTGGAAASITAASLTVTDGGTSISCTSATTTTLPLAVPGGGGGSLAWSCTAQTGTLATLHVTIIAQDQNGQTPAVSVPDLAFGPI